MMRNFLSGLLALVVIVTCIVSLNRVVRAQAVSSPPSSNPLDATCSVDTNKQSSLCSSQPTGDTNPIGGSQGVLAKVINIVLVGAGIAAVMVIIVGGLEYVMSAGDSAKINTAKNTILYAVIGLVIAVSAELILKLVVGRL